MTKAEQNRINEICDAVFETATKQLQDENVNYNDAKRLRNCQAWVYETTDFYILRSYNTLVAIIDKANDTCIDVLRTVYGYTSTSSQHISKFCKDYGSGKWGCEKRYTAR